jgi:hypothetical protein
LVAALHFLAALRLPVGVFNDDAANILLARSLTHGSYSFPGGFGAPEEYLPAFPLLLALPARLVEPHWGLLRAIPLAFLALCLFLTWRLARRFLSPEAAAAVALLVALNPVMVGFSGLVLPYLPYLALSLALIDAADAGGDRRSFFWLAAGAGLAPLIRPQGVVLIGCLALAQWHRRGLRRAAAFLALALVPAFAWTARNHLRAGSSLDYVDTWRAHVAALGEAGPLERASRLLSTIFGYPFLALPGSPALQSVYGALTLALALFGAVVLLKKREDSRVFVLTSYVGGLVCLHLTWAWTDPRYLILFTPLLWILLFAAAAKLLPSGRPAKAALLAALIALPLPVDLARARLGRAGSAAYQPGTMAWIRENSAPSARLMSVKSYAVALLTGRACLPQLPYRHANDWLDAARDRGVDYVHVAMPMPDDEFGNDEFPAGYQPALARWLDRQPAAAHLYDDAREGAVVYRLLPLDPARREKL